MLDFHIHRSGKGHPLVCIHGFLESSSMWDYLPLKSLDKTLYLVDLPGHGQSHLNKKYSSIQEIASAMSKALNLESFDIIGHSLGGYVAIELHKLQKIKGKLILFHSNFWEDSPQKKIDRTRVVEVVNNNKNFFLKEAIPNLFLESYRKSKEVNDLLDEALTIKKEAIMMYSELMRDRPDNTDYIMHQQENLLFIQGSEDHIVPATQIKNKLPNAQKFVKIITAGHMGHIENPDQAINFIKKFI